MKRIRNSKFPSALLLPDLIASVQKAAQNYGVKALAAELDMAPTSLYAALNPYGDRSSAKLGLEAAVQIMLITGDLDPLRMMASELGCRVVSMDAVPDKDSVDGEISDDFIAVAELAKALRRDADEVEASRLLEKAHDELDQSVRLRNSLAEQKGRA